MNEANKQNSQNSETSVTITDQWMAAESLHQTQKRFWLMSYIFRILRREFSSEVSCLWNSRDPSANQNDAKDATSSSEKTIFRGFSGL